MSYYTFYEYGEMLVDDDDDDGDVIYDDEMDYEAYWMTGWDCV